MRKQLLDLKPVSTRLSHDDGITSRDVSLASKLVFYGSAQAASAPLYIKLVFRGALVSFNTNPRQPTISSIQYLPQEHFSCLSVICHVMVVSLPCIVALSRSFFDPNYSVYRKTCNVARTILYPLH